MDPMVEPWEDEERLVFRQGVIPAEAGTQEPSWRAAWIQQYFPGVLGPGSPLRDVRDDNPKHLETITPDPRR